MARSLARSILALALSIFAIGALAFEPPMRVQASARQADGKIVYGGWSRDYGRTILARLHPDGTRDQYFGGCCEGTAIFDAGTPDFILKSMAVLADGKILLLAEREGQIALVRFDSEGVLDTSFGSQTPGMVIDSQSAGLRVNAIVAAAGGGILGFGSVPPPAEFMGLRAGVVRYNPDGSRDMSFGDGGAMVHPIHFGQFKAAVVAPGGAIAAAGYATRDNGWDFRQVLVAKFLADGTPDMGFGSDGWISVNPDPPWPEHEALAIAADSAGNLMAVGRAIEYRFEEQVSRSLLMTARFSPTGAILEFADREVLVEPSPWPTAAAGTAVTAMPDGEFVIAGTVIPDDMNTPNGRGFITQGVGGAVRVLPNGNSLGDSLDFVHAAPGGQFIVLGSRQTYYQYYDSRRIRYFTGPIEYDTDFAQDYPWDEDPNPFAIQPVAGAAPSTEVTSVPFRITGILVPALVRLEGGTVSVGCSGDYLPYAYVENGQWLCVRVLTGETSGSTTTAVVSIGYYQQATFSVTTVGPPQTTITSTPPEPSGSYALFYYAADSVSGPLLGYECRVDMNPFAPCPDNNHVQVGPLSEGLHSFEVRAINSYGADPTPAIHRWYVGPPPETYILSGPGYRSAGTATFEFNSVPSVDYFLCRLDETGGWQPCTSPKTYTNLGEGGHQFEVYAAGLDADYTPAQYVWWVDLTGPDTDINGWSGTATYVPTTTFNYIAPAEPAATFECSLDGGPWYACPGGSTSVTVSPGSHSFSVRAVDEVGNADPTPDTRGWIYYGQPPETTILSGPSGTVASTTATFTYSSSNMPAMFECSLSVPGYGGSFVTCYSGGVTYSGLANGAYVFAVRARTNDGTVDATPAQRDFIVDTVAPITAFTAGPSGTVNNNLATFEFAANESGVAFACALDGAPEAPCTSPVDLPGLADGSHTFSVAGTDAAGNRGAPATRTWQVDRSGPDTSITSGPSGATAQASAAFTFASNEAGSTFECRLDGATFGACTSPASYPGLAEGAHTFEVRALDALGNADPSPASAAWTVDTSAPDTVLDSGPSGTTGQSTATFTFHASEPGTTFECSVDYSAFDACVSGVSYSGIGNGMHLFEVRARDAQGNVDATPASATWSVDLTQPGTTITSGPAVFTTATGATFTFTSTEAGTFFCALDGAAFSACTSPVSYAALDAGPHGFAVYATDAYGNADDSPATWTWVVDTVAPETTITSSPGAASNSTTATFEFASSEADSTFECKLDAGAWGACTSPRAYPGLAAGSHTFQVRARDFLGNQDASPATHAWIIDTTAPGTSITSGPSGNNNRSTVTFTFASSEPGAGFQCRLDGAAFAPCASPLTYSGLAVGSHTFRVRAVDAAGNVDGSPATRNFGVK